MTEDNAKLQSLIRRLQAVTGSDGAAIQILEKLCRAMEAGHAAQRLALENDAEESANAGDDCLEASLALVRLLAAAELDRVLLAGILQINSDEPEARNPTMLNAQLSALSAELAGGVAGDPARNSVRSGLQRLLLVMRPLMTNNFTEVCADSIIKINFGDVKSGGWLAIPPKGKQGQASGAGAVRKHQGSTCILYETYYHAGYHKMSIESALEIFSSRARISAASLIKYRQKNSLLGRCEERKTWGQDHREAGAAYQPRERAFPRKGGGTKSTISSIGD